MIHSTIRRVALAMLVVAASFTLGSRESHAQKREVSIAAASDLQFAMKDLAGQFEKGTGNILHITYGSSGNFFSQLQNGAPFDVFFSADIDYPRRLESAGLTEPGTVYSYAMGRIVIWMPRDSQIDLHLCAL